MEPKHSLIERLGLKLIVLFLFLGLLYMIPWNDVVWGKIKLLPGDTVTVVGEAKTQQQNQKATFSAGVSTVSDDKNTAIAEVNRKVDAIIEAVKTFGIPADSIKTQNLNVYQGEETYYEDNRQKSRPGQWRVSNTVEITLNDVARATDLADILTKSGANNMYGPNFSVDDTGEAEMGLLEEAIKNAHEKAVLIAASNKQKVGAMVSVTEGYNPAPVYRYDGMGAGGGGGGLEPGTATVTKTVTVTYELR